MKKNGHFTMKKFKKYLYETRKNKLASIILIIAGLVSVIVEKDITILVMACLVGIPMFITRENWIS